MKSAFAIILFCHIGSASFCQNAQQNLMKYWKHRSQLDRFILKGEGIDPVSVHGSYLPAEHRRPLGHPGKGSIGGDEEHFLDKWPNLAHTEANPTCGGLNIGADATMYLGWYIGVLATEYRLLKNHGQSTGETERELWGALKAYERLDRMAERRLDEKCGN